MKIFIYEIPELKQLLEYFENPPFEMDMFDFFIKKLNNNYEIVDELEKSDIAFIPIDYIKLIYGRVKTNQWYNAHTSMCDSCGQINLVPKSQPQAIGIGEKEKYIKFFWDCYIKNKINLKSKIPHFILYSYVLFEVSFESIDESVFILSYEDRVSIFNSPNLFDLGVKNRVIPIPYIQNSNDNWYGFSLPIVNEHVKTKKEIDFSFIGTISDNNRQVLTSSRSFIKNIENRINIVSVDSIIETLFKTKYLFVLRGDTPTRINFYQCFAYDVVPIIFNSEINLYSKILPKEYPLNDSCLILPDKGTLNNYEYSKVVDSIISSELSNNQNYLNKIKNHEHIFSQINYFSEECKPIKNALKQIKLNAKKK